MKRWLLFVLLLLTAALAALLLLRKTSAASGEQSPPLVGLSALGGDFARAQPGREFSFPRDHGAHPEFQTEWWYYTGNLQAADGREFGFQLTFFRRALPAQPGAEGAQPPSAWRTDQVYLGHFALSDVQSGQFHYFERFSRGAAGLAGAVGEPGFQVWLDDWRVEQIGADQYRLYARSEDITLDLVLTDRKGPVLQGQNGYSPKGPKPGNASYYYSQTRLEATGTIGSGGQTFAVQGLSWMDHEFSTSALGANQVGWDWFSIQLDDGSEVMLFTLRNQDGTVDGFSSGALISADGSVQVLENQDFAVEPTTVWNSPETGAKYPSAWQINIPSAGLKLQIQPKITNQELRLSFVYWEGAVSVVGERAGVAVKGSGYVELTGYAQSMQGQF